MLKVKEYGLVNINKPLKPCGVQVNQIIKMEKEVLITKLDEQLEIIAGRIYELEMALEKERKEFVVVRECQDYLKA